MAETRVEAVVQAVAQGSGAGSRAQQAGDIRECEFTRPDNMFVPRQAIHGQEPVQAPRTDDLPAEKLEAQI